jgi:hypothetical protein
VTAPGLTPALALRLLDQIVLDRVRMVLNAQDLPELEEDLIGLIDEVRRPGDPESKPLAIHMILIALHKHDEELADEERALRLAQAVAS